MARIPDKDIERLKSEVSLQRLVETHGIELKKQGQDYVGLCPFHDDNDPSLVISPKKNLWHCLGACQRGGSVIDWVMQIEGISFRHAVELLQSDTFTVAASTPKPVKRSRVQKLDTPFETTIEDQQLLNQVIDYYHQTLLQSPEAIAYLEKRGITNNEVINTFKLGFANRSLGYRLPPGDRKAGSEIRGQLQGIGLYRSSGHEHFNGSLVIPVYDEQNNVVEVYGRKITPKLRPGTPKHLYLPGPHKGVWNLNAVTLGKEIILCESLIDALTFWNAGYRNVTASYGIEGFTKDHLDTFAQHQVERVLIAYDRDDAGETATEKLSKQLLKAGIDCYRIHFPKNMDANDYALQVQPAAKSLGIVINSAIWLGKGEAPNQPTTPTIIDDEVKETAPSIPLVAIEQTPALLPPGQRLPEPSKLDIDAEINHDEVIVTFGDRRYRIRGLEKNLSYDLLKVNLLVSQDDALHVDTFDLYSARHRTQFIKQAAFELGVKEDVIKTDLGKVLIKLELLQQQQIDQTLAPKESVIMLSDDEEQAALSLLKAPDLLSRLLTDFNQCGVVGEETNKLVGYLAAVSRKLDNPLAIIIQSTSAAGKSSLMDAVLAMMPEEDKVQYAAMTGQSLFYMGETDLKHKILAIVEEEGAHQASYALKLLQSEGELTIASTGKDPQTGRLETQEYRVEGPVMLFLTTTAIEIDDELLNRCLVLTVNEDRDQTKAIHQLQRKRRTLEGLLAKQTKQDLLTLHRNAQRLLKPLAVVNPYAEQLTFLDDRTRTRRDHEKYLTLIESIALLHQYQREIKTVDHHSETLKYIEVTIEDIDKANHLAHEILGRTLDELPPQTRRLLELVHSMVTEQCQQQAIEQAHYRFTRRDVREHTGWSDTQLKIHLSRLADMEYLVIHTNGHRQRHHYELLYQGQGQAGDTFLMGLIEPDKLTYDANWSGQKANRSGSGRPVVGGQSGSGRGKKKAGKPDNTRDSNESEEIRPKTTYPGNHYEAGHNPIPLVAKGG